MSDVILEDERRIKAIISDDWWRAVGVTDGVTGISVVPCAGDGAWIAWFDVFYDGARFPRERVNSRFVHVVEYFDE